MGQEHAISLRLAMRYNDDVQAWQERHGNIRALQVEWRY